MSNEEWQLPMPSGISLNHHSFTIDLLKQFNCETSDISSVEIESIQSTTDVNTNTTKPDTTQLQQRQQRQQRRRSAGDLIRKSSSYFKKWNEPLTWTLKRKKRKDYPPPVQNIFTQKKLSKIAINTTISIAPSSQQPSGSIKDVQPPIITQYPPTPLKYSPVEPLMESMVDTHKKRKTLHRLSVPILKITSALQPQKTEDDMLRRRRSDSDLVYHLEDTRHNNSSFLTTKWNKLIHTCKRGFKKKRHPPIHL
ncbi:hypothetical protein G6F70_006326 [Rhizopus microsporus]|nr:hypothetical protein G6F71_001641 [Rhizopus microsporus]KAG1197814.1 hypothetical protein G6F70_006326 [Rhizopus microsporus]KAG1209608.1 hypothetical protein G6F69_006203 [Rhizopus microsporus]KAG1231015.1 hypothetical protein G6F67_006054 [Rhizopus microsporus]KAG1266751.1 hypothetical protein G6F68_002494 [Rhizopus microsporus]